MKVMSRIKGKIQRLVLFVQLYGQHFWPGVRMVFAMRCSVLLLRGPMTRGGGSLTLLYAGRNYNYHYLLKAIFESYTVVEERRMALPAIRRHVDQMTPKSDVVLLDVGWPYQGLLNRRGIYLEIPDWANMSFPLSDSWEETVQLFHRTIRRNDLRYIRQNEYRCELTTDRADIERFYDEMYLPFIQSRHGDGAVKEPRRQVIRRARKGGLQQIFQGDRVVLAGVVYPEGEVLYFLWIGMPSDCIENPPKAGISALFYFTIRYAFDHGFEVLDFLGTRTFLTDGSFCFKRRWGCVIDDSFSPNSLFIKPQRGNMNAARFCRNFPMLARRNEGFEGIFLSMDETVDEERLLKLYAQYGCGGIDRITVVDISGRVDSGCRDLVVDDHAFRLIGAGPEDFPRHYAKHAVCPEDRVAENEAL